LNLVVQTHENSRRMREGETVEKVSRERQNQVYKAKRIRRIRKDVSTYRKWVRSANHPNEYERMGGREGKGGHEKIIHKEPNREKGQRKIRHYDKKSKM